MPWEGGCYREDGIYGHGVGSSRSLPLTVVLGAFGMQQAADLTHCQAGVGEGLGAE